jgi:hypothetical protein
LHESLRAKLFAVLTEVDCGLHAVAVPLEIAQLLELGIGTESALDLANRPVCPVGLRRYEYPWCPVLKSFGISKRSCCTVLSVRSVRHFPHTPSLQISCESAILPPTPAGDSAPTGIDSKIPANPGPQASPLRALAAWVAIHSWFWDPGNSLMAVSSDYWGPFAMKLIPAGFCWGRGGCGCRWRSASPETFAPNSGATMPPSLPLPKEEDRGW